MVLWGHSKQDRRSKELGMYIHIHVVMEVPSLVAYLSQSHVFKNEARMIHHQFLLVDKFLSQYTL
jgi:hypothetical protein